MTESASLQPDPTKIGEVSAPPFAVLPNPGELFERREARLRRLAPGHPLEPFLLFIADIAKAQRAALDELPPVVAPTQQELARAREFAMPAVDRAQLPADPVFLETMNRFFAAAEDAPATEEARLALAALRASDASERERLARAVLDGDESEENLADLVFMAAALQVHMTRLAARLDAVALVPVGDGICPVCGGPPCASMVVGWHGAHGSRFCACAMCGALWNYVRIRCVACGSTKGISYSAAEGSDEATKVERCSECGSYLKIFYQTLSPHVEPFAEDVASLALDMLVIGEGMRRAGYNPFLLGY
jgi:FdhE protein